MLFKCYKKNLIFFILNYFIIIVFLSSLFRSAVFAQDQAENNPEESGAYVTEKVSAEDTYVRQNLFNSNSSEIINDRMAFLISPELSLTNMAGTLNYFVSLGFSVDLNHYFRIGFILGYMPTTTTLPASGSTNNSRIQSVRINSLYYAANSLFLSPFSDYILHPNLGVYLGFGQMQYTLLDQQASEISSNNESFLTIIPTIEAEVNIIQNLMASFVFAYRTINSMGGEVGGLNSAQISLKGTVLLP